jgi:hypothetical protein
MDGWVDGWMGGWMDGWMDVEWVVAWSEIGWLDVLTDGSLVKWVVERWLDIKIVELFE